MSLVVSNFKHKKILKKDDIMVCYQLYNFSDQIRERRNSIPGVIHEELGHFEFKIHCGNRKKKNHLTDTLFIAKVSMECSYCINTG